MIVGYDPKADSTRLIFGTPTLGDGELPKTLEAFLPQLESVDSQVTYRVELCPSVLLTALVYCLRRKRTFAGYGIVHSQRGEYDDPQNPQARYRRRESEHSAAPPA